MSESPDRTPEEHASFNELGLPDKETERLEEDGEQPEQLLKDIYIDPTSPKAAPTRKSETAKPSPNKHKEKANSGSSSSLSPASQIQSPTVAPQVQDAGPSARVSPSPSSSSLDSHQPIPAPSIMQHQTFGTDPLAFDDPTIYHVRKVTDDMTDEEKKEIYGVAQFPHDDLSHLIAGVPPDKDFSNAKPTNQVHANTFNAYLDPYFRSLTDEDLAFLKERVSQFWIIT